ncbi:MAG: MFS transporter [Spirochaetes bacterium]|nr:MFS transporter [Spirochaetota bacterium]
MATKKKAAKKQAKKKQARAAKKKAKKSKGAGKTRQIPEHHHTLLESEAAAAGVVAVEERKQPIFSKVQWSVLLILAFIQFMHIVDFMVLMPLNKKFEELFHITTNQFGWLVSSYTLAAFLSGIAGTFFVERISRKRTLLFAFAGFIIGNLICAMAPGYKSFLLARVVTGAFGGILSGISFAIIGDLIEPQKRGRATGIIMISFSVASVAGVPAGIWLASKFFPQLPYYLIAALSAPIFAYAFIKLPSLNQHLFGPRSNIIRQVTSVFAESKHVRLYLLMIFHFIAAFSIIPYIAGFMQKNHNVSDTQLQIVYLCGGLVTIASSAIVGGLTDKLGSVKVYSIVSALASIPFILVTNSWTHNFYVLLLFVTLFFIFVSGRMVPAMALLNNTVTPSVRGTFMSLNGSVQQLAMSLGAIAASFILVAPPNQPIQHYAWVGIFGVVFNIAAILVANTFKNR